MFRHTLQKMIGNLFGERSERSTPTTFRPRFDVLEGREMPSATPAVLAPLAATTTPATTAATVQPPTSTPGSLTEQQQIANLEKRLNALIGALQNLPEQKVGFGGQLGFGSGGWLIKTPVDAYLKEVDAIKAAGADRLAINLVTNALDPVVEQKYDAIIARARADGLKIELNPSVKLNNQKMSFSQWEATALEFFPKIAARWHPDIFVVVHEPSTMDIWMGSQATAAQWADFAAKTAAAVKAVSPNTLIGAGGLPIPDQAAIQAFMKLPQIDLITVDLYNLTDFPVAAQLVTQAKAAGKTIFNEETWRPNGNPLSPAINTGDPAYAPVDQLWMKAVSLFAATNGLNAVTPFNTETYFTYAAPGTPVTALSPVYEGQVVAAIEAGQRTATYKAYESAIAEFGGPQVEPL